MSKKTAITPTRGENYPEWYLQVIQAADLAEHSPVRGCMIIKPNGYAIWENMQKVLDSKFKATGHKNAYFPLLIPLSYLQKEAEHVEGFAKECAVVTHHRLKLDNEGQLQPDGELEEPLIIRPTSETIINVQFAKWIQSYRDLPLKINQWANVMRWEMRTRLFLRTSEFLWQEGHTAHATAEEAREETLQMLHIYAEFAREYMAMPVFVGEKTADERFPGAENTYCIEAIMQDGKALQAGTSHFLGQNFSKSFGITFTNEQSEIEHAWTTSWGVSTRLIGGLIMTHSDDDGLVLPPRIAPVHIVIIPIYRNAEDQAQVMPFCQALQADLQKLHYHENLITVEIDNRDKTSGERSWQAIKQGIPLRIEVGPRDIANDNFPVKRRANNDAPLTLKRESILKEVPKILDDIQTYLYDHAEKRNAAFNNEIHSKEDFIKHFSDTNEDAIVGYTIVHCADTSAIQDLLKPLKLTARCILEDQPRGNCLFTGKPNSPAILFAKAY